MHLPDRLHGEVSAHGCIRPSQEWKEIPLENEEEQFARIVQRIVNRVNETADKTKDKPRRAFHAKIHAGVVGDFKVLPDVPEAAKFGVFAKPAALQGDQGLT